MISHYGHADSLTNTCRILVLPHCWWLLHQHISQLLYKPCSAWFTTFFPCTSNSSHYFCSIIPLLIHTCSYPMKWQWNTTKITLLNTLAIIFPDVPRMNHDSPWFSYYEPPFVHDFPICFPWRFVPCQAPHSPDDKPPKVAFMGSELPGAAALGWSAWQRVVVLKGCGGGSNIYKLCNIVCIYNI